MHYRNDVRQMLESLRLIFDARVAVYWGISLRFEPSDFTYGSRHQSFQAIRNRAIAYSDLSLMSENCCRPCNYTTLTPCGPECRFARSRGLRESWSGYVVMTLRCNTLLKSCMLSWNCSYQNVLSTSSFSTIILPCLLSIYPKRCSLSFHTVLIKA